MLSLLHKENFAQIWNWFPKRLNPFSSNWWFFLLCPQQSDGYGPKQMMFAMISKVGETIQINHTPHPGIPGRKTSAGVEDPFDTFSVGWIHTQTQMHHHLVHQAATAQIVKGKSIHAWSPQGYGGEIIACEDDDKPFATHVHFRGDNGEAHFEAWGSTDSELNAPDVIERQTIFGDANAGSWRHLHFSGQFTSPEGTEHLSGIGYFQRVCLNIPPFPWKWVWGLFADGSVFSCFIPYLGPHLLRRGNRFFPEWFENITFPLQTNAYFSRGGYTEAVLFSKQRIHVRPQAKKKGTKPYPQFDLHCEADNGDFLSFTAVPYAHTQFLMDRPMLKNGWSSRYNYNEFLFQTANLRGIIGGQKINPAQLGAGYGNCEYTWGLGL